MARFLWICLGGAVGTGARYLLSSWLLRLAGSGFPYPTLIVNAIGSFVLGMIMPVVLWNESFSPTLRLALTTGVVGGFTTYSTFNYEALSLFQRGAWLLGLAYLVGTLVLCLVAGGLGLAVSRLFTG